ncbi:Rrf2 family transcriptional regulator [Pseudodesulfovibrio sp. F-1]|uniref:Rrf2 family transcriptional regulator n=1 Tax=Pseudodesulfovibrio alkaliphilus TaxID=2661613 RepID=A0A7K1KLM0_9BACT|nr:Rrf2 family transcriptional regulator [Pseudodesulfovibrio alkaliphilus]MUM76973.1 Rrf2 family transcriptional regulator [Pseudodesulfovibrio alkaliphilus]
MKLSARSRYAARLLLELAAREGETPICTADLAKSTGISAPFIEQIIRPLKQAGMIASMRGASGGHMLDGNPADITLGEIVRTMEGSANIATCLDCETVCNRSEDCLTRTVWERASRAMERELDAITLADLLSGDLPCGTD